MDFVTQLLNVVFSLPGLIGLALGLVLVVQANRSPRLAWLLFSLCCFAASLGKFRDEFVLEPPPLVFPLQQLRDNGRPLAIVLLALVFMVGQKAQNGWRQQLVPQAVRYLFVVQIVVLIKTLLYGDPEFAILAILTFGFVVYTVKLGPSRWLQNDEAFRLAVWSIAMVAIIFMLVNAYQALFDRHPITFVQGRFLGTTGNPLHATVLLASTVPCFVFMIESSPKWLWNKIFWIFGLLCTVYALFLTGSRTGVLMSAISILFFYRQKPTALLRLGLVIGVALIIILPTIGIDISSLDAADPAVADRFTSTDNTRAGPWAAMWRAFTTYPVFGAPLRGSRIIYGENSWLGAGANLGIMGLFPLILFGVSCMQTIVKISQLSKRNPSYFLQASTVVAGLTSLLIGSIFEAFLLGNLSFALLVLLTYLLLGQYLMEVDRTIQIYNTWAIITSSQSPIIEPQGNSSVF